MNIVNAPWRFDGHGINTSDGTRICQVMHIEPYTNQTGHLERNKKFDELSNLIAACPEMYETLKWLSEFSCKQKDHSTEETYALWSKVQMIVNQTINIAKGQRQRE